MIINLFPRSSVCFSVCLRIHQNMPQNMHAPISPYSEDCRAAMFSTPADKLVLLSSYNPVLEYMNLQQTVGPVLIALFNCCICHFLATLRILITASAQIARRGGLLIEICLQMKSLRTLVKLAIIRFSQLKPILRYL